MVVRANSSDRSSKPVCKGPTFHTRMSLDMCACPFSLRSSFSSALNWSVLNLELVLFLVECLFHWFDLQSIRAEVVYGIISQSGDVATFAYVCTFDNVSGNAVCIAN